MRRFNVVVLIVFVLGCSAGSPIQGEKEKGTATATGDMEKDRKALEGVWGKVLFVWDGVEVENDPTKKTLTFKGEEMIEEDKEMPDRTYRGTFKIDSRRNPKTLTYHNPRFNKTVKYVYELKDDKLTLCSNSSSNEFPKEITGKGDEQSLGVYKRQK
jgi:uncharacterized protein (TIGR03067 family)